MTPEESAPGGRASCGASKAAPSRHFPGNFRRAGLRASKRRRRCSRAEGGAAAAAAAARLGARSRPSTRRRGTGIAWRCPRVRVRVRVRLGVRVRVRVRAWIRLWVRVSAHHAQPCGQREGKAVAAAVAVTQEQRGKRCGQSDADAARRSGVPASIHERSGGAHARRRAEPGQQQQQPRRQPRRHWAAECEGCRGGSADANQSSKPREQRPQTACRACRRVFARGRADHADARTCHQNDGLVSRVKTRGGTYLRAA